MTSVAARHCMENVSPTMKFIGSKPLTIGETKMCCHEIHFRPYNDTMDVYKYHKMDFNNVEILF